MRLSKEIEDRLASLAEKTGRTKSFYISQALEEHLEEMEDAYLAEKRCRTLGETISLDELLNESEAAREFDIRAAGELRKLAPEVRRKILLFLREKIETDLDPRRFGKALQANLAGLWRYRIEDYRIVCVIRNDRLVVLALIIGHRRDIYR